MNNNIEKFVNEQMTWGPDESQWIDENGNDGAIFTTLGELVNAGNASVSDDISEFLEEIADDIFDQETAQKEVDALFNGFDFSQVADGSYLQDDETLILDENDAIAMVHELVTPEVFAEINGGASELSDLDKFLVSALVTGVSRFISVLVALDRGESQIKDGYITIKTQTLFTLLRASARIVVTFLPTLRRNFRHGGRRYGPNEAT